MALVIVTQSAHALWRDPLHVGVQGYRGTSIIRNGRHKKQSVFGVSRFLIIKKRTPSVLGDFSDFRAKSLKFSDFRAKFSDFRA